MSNTICSLLFVITTALSIRFAMVFRKTGNAPWDAPMPSHESQLEAQNKDAWSADTHEIDHPDHDSDTHTERGGNQEEDEYALLNATETDEGRHSGRPVGWGGEGRYNEGDGVWRTVRRPQAGHGSARQRAEFRWLRGLSAEFRQSRIQLQSRRRASVIAEALLVSPSHDRECIRRCMI